MKRQAIVLVCLALALLSAPMSALAGCVFYDGWRIRNFGWASCAEMKEIRWDPFPGGCYDYKAITKITVRSATEVIIEFRDNKTYMLGSDEENAKLTQLLKNHMKTNPKGIITEKTWKMETSKAKDRTISKQTIERLEKESGVKAVWIKVK